MSTPSLHRRAPRHTARALLFATTALAAGGALALVPPTTHRAGALAAPAPHAFADPIFSADARGDIVTIGNVSTTCDPTYQNANWGAAESAAACNGATSGATGLSRYDGAPMPPINNRLSMEPVDVDGDASTFSSSTAQLHLPAGSTVLWAGLHWNAATDVPAAAQLYGSTYEVPPPSVAKRFQVRLRTPSSGSYTALDAQPADGAHRDTWDDTNPGGTVSYGAFVDVTDLVRAGGSGAYTVADVQACRGFGGCFGSWSLTVAIANRSMPPRNLNVWHGWQLTTPSVAGGAQEFAVNGITPPPRGPVSARIGVVQADGDRGLGPDSLDISSPSAPAWKTFATADRPLNPGEGDWFNSTVNAYGQRRPAGDATPNLLANLNQDIALVQDDTVIGNTDTSFRFRVQTAASESLYSQVVHAAVDLYAPEIQIDKTVSPAGPVPTGTAATWSLDVRNVGIDPIRQAVVTDPLPAGVTYVPGSVRFASGGPATLLGAKTDTAGDDEAAWDAASRTLTFHVGAGATAAAGGTMAIAPAADGSDHLVIEFRTRVDAAPGATVTNTATAGGQGRALQDPYGPLTTRDTDPARIATAPESDLGITKTDGDAVVRAVGDRFTYRLTGTNAGPSPATGVTMTDALDPMLRFASSSDGCTATGQDVTCPVGALAVGATAVRTFTVEVVRLPGPGKQIPNVAAIKGDQPDPDCTATTPKALCNHDDELTPQPAVDLGITKTDHDAMVRAVGDRFTYRLTVTNAGPDDATGVTITDRLDPMIAFVSSPGCSAAGQLVTCAIADLAARATRTADVTVRVVRLPDADASIPNVATVRGTEPDPDCTDATPEALCNHDDEHTPRITTTVDHRVTVPDAPPAPTQPGTLPFTGAPIRTSMGVGALLLATGAMALRGSRWARRLRTSGPGGRP